VVAVLVPLLFAVLPAPARGQSCPTWKPAVTWNTYLGGGTQPDGNVSLSNRTDELEGIAVNAQGEVFVTGRTNSVAFPSTTGLPATGSGGSGFDAFVAKFSADGTRLEWVRVFGGTEDDSGARVVLGSSGEVYVVGTTQSSELLAASGAGKTVLTHQGSANGKDAFLAKLTASGELSWFMFLGGGETDEGLGVDVGPDNTVYVVGRSNSALSTLGTKYGQRGDAYDGFIVKVDVADPLTPKPVWTRLLGSEDTRFGFDADDAAYTVLATQDGVYVGGIAGSIMLDVASTAVREEFHRGDDDGFVAKLNPADSTVVWLTNLGYGNGTTEVRDLLARSDGGFVAVGNTDSSDFITATSGSGRDVFVFQLDADGRDINVKRRLSGAGDDAVEGHAAIDSQDNIFLGGQTGSAGFAANGFDDFEPSTDGFVMMLDRELNTRWASYVGGNSSNPEWVRGVAVDSQGRLSLSGSSASAANGFFKRDVGYDRSPNGGSDGFVFRVVLDSTAPTLTGTVTASATAQGRITASWDEFSEPESFIARYEWAISSSDGFMVRGFEPVEGRTATDTNFLPVVGTPYYVTVRATNGAGCAATARSSTDVVLTSPPEPNPDPDGGDGSEVLSPLGWGCSTGGGSPVGLLSVLALAVLMSRRARAAESPGRR
jgi:hypothetical protein